MNFAAGIIGAGAWGTALAQSIALTEKRVLIWCYEEDTCKKIQKTKTNPFLKGLAIAETVEATTSLKEIAEQKVLFIAAPANCYTEILSQLNQYITDEHKIIISSKGFRPSDGALLSDVIEEVLTSKPQIGILAGPAFAKELAAGKPCMLTISSKHIELINTVNEILSYNKLRIYNNDDIIGAQIGAALKNIVAIASGIADALELGESVCAAIISRGLKEIERYARVYGAQNETIYGLAGLGDTILTASSKTSRNYDFGYYLGTGLTRQEATEKVDGYMEGIQTARIVTTQSLSQGIDLAIISAVDGIIQGDVLPEKVVEFLMQRPRTHELDT
ncbi:MAG: Glycerol-3-phosphate dehydrogenase [NAD(P)+] [Proteobacteria bacterium]|nr:MAG: Glycerol-3-phosphate dehydrogenase [NAD(P)+] [Pseudomonadota bacterium]